MRLFLPITKGIFNGRSSLGLLMRFIAILEGSIWNDGAAVRLTIDRFRASGVGSQLKKPINLKLDCGLPDLAYILLPISPHQ